MDKKFSVLSVLAILIAVVLIGCTSNTAPVNSSPSNPTHLNVEPSTKESVTTVVDSNNQFAFDLYSKYKPKDGNIFFSPYSISTAIAMTYEGARGQTAEEMATVFHFSDLNSSRPAFASIYNGLNKADKKYELKTANALWAQKDYPFLSSYFETVESYYGGKFTNLDFITKTEESRVLINSWVEKQTNDKITNLLEKGVINSDTRLVLTNAIYFKGKWQLQFEKKNTEEKDFTTPTTTVKAQMMSITGKDAKFNYVQLEGLQALELPYEGDEISMLILLPTNGKMQELENSLSIEKLAQIKSQLRKTEAQVFIPKFKFDTKYSMAKDLAEMGMPTAFNSDKADFSGMDGSKDLYISNVIHQAYVDVNEEGTEAAAATAVVMTRTMAAPPSRPELFLADHPFIFIIQDNTNGEILFLGRVNNPTTP
jgi:serpin B